MLRNTFYLSLSLAVLFLTGCQKKAATEQPTTLVAVYRVQPEKAIPAQRYTGQVRARYEFNASFRVAGKIAQRLVEVGDTVKAGQILATLDTTDFRLAVEAAENELESAIATEVQAGLEEKRMRDLIKRKMLSDSEYDAAKAAADSSAAAVRRSRRMLELAQNRLHYCELKAEHESVVTSVLAEAGSVINDGTSIFQLARLDQREVVVDLPENRIDHAKKQQGHLTLWANANASYEIRLREIAPNADPVTRTYRARYTVINPGDDVRLGMTAIVELDTNQSENVISIPMTAIVHRKGETGVWLVDPACGKLALQPIKIQSYGDDLAVLSGGLKANDCIVRAGVQKLDEQSLVHLWDGDL